MSLRRWSPCPHGSGRHHAELSLLSPPRPVSVGAGPCVCLSSGQPRGIALRPHGGLPLRPGPRAILRTACESAGLKLRDRRQPLVQRRQSRWPRSALPATVRTPHCAGSERRRCLPLRSRWGVLKSSCTPRPAVWTGCGGSLVGTSAVLRFKWDENPPMVGTFGSARRRANCR